MLSNLLAAETAPALRELVMWHPVTYMCSHLVQQGSSLSISLGPVRKRQVCGANEVAAVLSIGMVVHRVGCDKESGC